MEKDMEEQWDKDAGWKVTLTSQTLYGQAAGWGDCSSSCTRALESARMLPSALQACFPALRISQPQEEEVVCAKLVGKCWRQQQLCICHSAANFWKLPWLCAKMDSAQRKREMEEVMWPNGPWVLVFLLYNSVFPMLLIKDNLTVAQILSFMS